jgi:hypothetical protein
LDVFGASCALPARTLNLLLENEIEVLPPSSWPVLQLQLFGSDTISYLTEIA